jgi:carboxynorspermidine decarboxylase
MHDRPINQSALTEVSVPKFDYPNMQQFQHLDYSQIPDLAFVIDHQAIKQNLEILQWVAEQSGVKVLAALKAFSMWHFGSLVSDHLSGICASGIHEAQLGYEEYGGKNGKEVHVFSAAFSATELNAVCQIANHIVLNSLTQWQRFSAERKAGTNIHWGLRINPEHSEGSVPLYDPCSPNSRLGITLAEFETAGYLNQNITGLSGLHFHTLCEQGFEPLSRTLDVVEEKFSWLLKQVSWVNFGGGHHITHSDYDLSGLVQRIRQFKQRYNVEVYLEPGEAVAIHSGVLVTEVLDIRGKHNDQLILNTSATCHMPDTLEMPYRPDILGAGKPNQKAYTYKLGGMTCLAGDNLGEYSFDHAINIGDRLVFMDMSHYTMVKTTTFNGINLPTLVAWDSKTKHYQTLREFGYQDFKNRLS